MAIRTLVIPVSLAFTLSLALGCKGDGGSPPRSVQVPAPTVAPAITRFAPETGHPGERVSIEGTHLTGVTRVDFGGVEATGILETEGRVTVSVPVQGRTGPITVHCRAGKAQTAAPFHVTARPFDPALDVVPFSMDQVKHWPGLTNLRSSCFVNTAIKLLASMPDVDSGLLDRAGEDAAAAGVRRQLRMALNYIRQGDTRPAGAQDPMRALVDAFQHHDVFRKYVQRAQGDGGSESQLMDDLFTFLGLKGRFTIPCRERYYYDEPASSNRYADHAFGMVVSSDRALTGYDLSAVHSLSEFVGHVTAKPGSTVPGSHWFRYPVRVPATTVIKLDHLAPKKALAFSQSVAVPIYAVDETRHTSRAVDTVLLTSTAVSLWNGSGGHVWAAIRGAEGWFINDDARPPRLVDVSELNGILDSRGNTVREAGLVILRRFEARWF